MDQADLFRAFRAAVPRLPDTATDSPDSMEIALRLKRTIAEHQDPLLLLFAKQLSAWRVEDQGTVFAGLRTREKGSARRPSSGKIGKYFAGEPDFFAQGLGFALYDTMSAALRHLEDRDTAFQRHVAEVERLADKILPFRCVEHISREIMPAPNVVAGIVYVAIEEQSLPTVGRTMRIVRNSTPLVNEMAALSSFGFNLVRMATMFITAKTKPRMRSIDIGDEKLRGMPNLGTLTGRHQLSLVERGTDQERLELSPDVVRTLLSERAPEAAAAVSRYRIGCPALRIRVGGMSLIEYLVDWSIEVLERFWRHMQL